MNEKNQNRNYISKLSVSQLKKNVCKLYLRVEELSGLVDPIRGHLLVHGDHVPYRAQAFLFGETPGEIIININNSN